jgi:uncharacterized protein (TIGR02996 family)
MTEGDVMLREIIANPADDWLRLIYADWIGEHGQERRAEFIRVQIELASPALALHASLPPGSTHLVYPSCQGCLRVQALRQREDRLRKGMYEVGGFVTHRRGFVAIVRCPLQAWLAHGPAIAAAHPVELVEVGSDILPGNSDPDIGPVAMIGAPWEGMDDAQKSQASHLIWHVAREVERRARAGEADAFLKGVSAGCLLWARQRHAPTAPAQR